MKKIHVDEILKKKDENLPGPDRYSNYRFFGNKPGQLACGSSHYSMRLKLDHFATALNKSKKRPGPGSYASNDLTGAGLNTSVMRNSIRSSVPKDMRFRKTQKFESPPPNNYYVNDELNKNFNSKRTFAG